MYPKDALNKAQRQRTVEWIKDALELLKTAYTPDEVCYMLTSYGQQDERFQWGETIKYSPSEVQSILKKPTKGEEE